MLSPIAYTVFVGVIFRERWHCCPRRDALGLKESKFVFQVSAAVSFFVLLPSYVTSFLQMLTCLDIEGTSKLVVDLELECFDSQHT